MTCHEEATTHEASRRRLCRVCGIRSPEAEASAVVETPPRAAGHRRDLEAGCRKGTNVVSTNGVAANFMFFD